MKLERTLLRLCFLFLLSLNSHDQEQEFVWFSSDDFQLQGKLQHEDTEAFQRLPLEMKSKVRERVWHLSENSSGLYLDFFTSSSSIEVTYEVSGVLAFPHMPATGVSGLDLYALDKKGIWHWVRGRYNFKEKLSYTFSGIESNTKEQIIAYRLYLPLYNTVKDLQIGIPKSENFDLIKVPEQNKPIVVYGTSIAQGACASRPGLAWTSILGRLLNQPVINLGFSGNGRLETEIVDFICKKTAALYILDCMPNFTSGQQLGPEQAKKRLRETILQIRKSQKDTPILLVEHAGYSDGALQKSRRKTYTQLNQATQEIFKQLQEDKIPGLYLLSKEELGLGIESFVDGTHPNDLGMVQYATAYEKIIRSIMENKN